MAKPAQSSFRRILLSRILLLSIPVLLTGELVAYQKVRDTLLDTARQNLTESAVRKGENIRDLTAATRSTVVAASNAFANQIETSLGTQPDQISNFLRQTKLGLPASVDCVEITGLQPQRTAATTCDRPIFPGDRSWSSRSEALLDPLASVQISSLSRSPANRDRQLNLVFSAPVHDRSGQLRYALSMQLPVHRQETSPPGSLSGYTVVIDQEGKILAHPQVDRIGHNIQQETDYQQLKDLVAHAIAGKQDFLRLFPPDRNGKEWLVGYSPIQVSLSPQQQRTWVILAVAPVENALAGLEDIKQVLFILTLGLLAANLWAAYYLSRDLARPIEQLRDYALHINQRQFDRTPRNFKVKELDQLAAALENMVQRLEERAEELESAWQEAQVANQLKSEFLATTSHELRTPLNAIIGCVRLVRDDCCDGREEELDFLQQADDAAIHLLKIINDLLDIAKIEAGKVELNLQPISIQDLCQQCLRMVQPGAEKKRLGLSIDVDVALERVPLDERRVRQMVINLLSNAVKFTPEGGQVKLAGRIGQGEQIEQDIRPDRSPINPDTPYLCLEVIDSGIGIPPERWHLLFRPFQQIDSSSTRKHEGTGLGLALTKRLAELHGGTISFRSTPGEGSTFRIWLPAPDVATQGENRTLLPSSDGLAEESIV